MTSEDDLIQLVDSFRIGGYHVERRRVEGSETVVVTCDPATVSGIVVYRRSVQLSQDNEGQWHTTVGMITLPWRQSLGALRAFVSDLMESEDAYSREQQRRLCDVTGAA